MNKDPDNDSSGFDNDYGECDINFKLIVVGDPGVGKSCLTLRAIKNTFEDIYSPTIGFEFFTYLAIVDGKKIKLQIWDTCGQEGYRALITSFYRNSSLAILVYSIDNEESFNHLDMWLNDIKTQSSPETKIVLIGNKSDLEQERKINKERGEQFYQEHKIDFFLETSAKLDINVKNLFDQSAKILYEKYKEYKEKKNPIVGQDLIPSSEPLKIDNNESKDKNRRKCFC